jgi:hypothetical protein
MALHEPLQTSPSGNALPLCPTCQTNGHTAPIQLHDLSPGVQYWRCKACGALRATDEGSSKSPFAY